MNGFAGSERAGERRRRRLAVESDGSEPALPRTSGDGDPLLRFFANAGREASQLTARNCPVLTVISAPTWKHCVGVFLCLAAALGLLFASHTGPQWTAAYGPGAVRLFPHAAYGPGAVRLFPHAASPVIIWVNTVALFMTAQAAWIVWWARSRSLRDFEGNYRIWGWAAATYLLFSFASATQAHLAWSDTILHYIRWRTPGATLWCWLLPASAWGWGLALRLEQELRENRSGHWLFLTAGAWYLGGVGLLCQGQLWPLFCSPDLSEVLQVALQMLGHAGLLLSTVLHARFVLCCTAEAPLSRRRTSKATAQAEGAPSRSRFRWPSWLFGSRSGSAEAETDEEEKPKRGRKRAAPAKKRATVRKARKVEVEEEVAEEETWETEEPGAEDEGYSEAAESETDNGLKNYRYDDAEPAGGNHFAESENDDGEGGRGLSKRERRKLQQEQRDQERRGRR